MIEIAVPGRCVYRLEHLLLDLNGTLSFDGVLIEGVSERMERLRNLLDIAIIAADTLGKAQPLGERLGVNIRKIAAGKEAFQKCQLVRQLGREAVAAIGNGANDAAMLPEGAASETLTNCDLVVNNINAALDLLLKQERLIATSRR